MKKKAKIMTALVAVMCCSVCLAGSRPHGGGGRGGHSMGFRPSVSHHYRPHHPHHHPHHHGGGSFWGRGGCNFWPGFIGGVVGGVVGGTLVDAVVSPAPVIVNNPAPVVVNPSPVIVNPAPTYREETVWVEGCYVDQVQPNGSVIRVWQPGHYETRQVQVY